MARNTQLPSNGNFLQSDLKRAIQKVLSRKQEALLGIVGGAMLLGTAPALAQEQASEELDEVVVTGLRGSMIASMNIKREATRRRRRHQRRRHRQIPRHQPRRVPAAHLGRLHRPRRRRRLAGHRPRLRQRLQPRHLERAHHAHRRRRRSAATSGQRLRHVHEPLVRLLEPGVGRGHILEVYKTGRAATLGRHRCDDQRQDPAAAHGGQQGVVGAKAMFDTSVENGSEVTPEVTGLYSWANDAENFGVSLFGSYQQRDSASVGAGNQDWNVERS